MNVYHDWMPVILRPENLHRWLNGEMGADKLGPAAEEALREWLVDRRINKTGAGDDDPTTIEPIESGLL